MFFHRKEISHDCENICLFRCSRIIPFVRNVDKFTTYHGQGNFRNTRKFTKYFRDSDDSIFLCSRTNVLVRVRCIYKELPNKIRNPFYPFFPGTPHLLVAIPGDTRWTPMNKAAPADGNWNSIFTISFSISPPKSITVAGPWHLAHLSVKHC